METNYLERLQGHALFVEQILIECSEGTNLISLIVSFEERKYRIVCNAISALSITCLSLPVWIEGFVVADNQQFGWQSDVRYKVYDFEGNSVCFCCEEIQVVCL